MRIARVWRWKVSSRPTGLAFDNGHLVVAESGNASISTFNLEGELTQKTRLYDGVNPWMRFTALGGTLLRKANGEFYFWTALAEGYVYLICRGKICGRVRLGPYPLLDWLYSPKVSKLVIAHANDRLLYFLPTYLNYVRPRLLGVEAGSLALSPDAKRLFVADRWGDEIRVIDMAEESVCEILPAGSAVAQKFPQRAIAVPFTRAPMTLSADGTTLYACPLRTDAGEQTGPLITIDIRSKDMRVLTGRGIRYPYQLVLNQARKEIYVAGYDETVVVDMRTGSVTRVLGPGRMTGFAVSANGQWASATDVYHRDVLIFDFEKQTMLKVPCSGIRHGEFVRIPVVIDESSSVAAVPDIEADQIVAVQVTH